MRLSADNALNAIARAPGTAQASRMTRTSSGDSAQAGDDAGGLARYEDFLRASVDWLWESDGAQRLVYVSAPVSRDLGIPPQQLLGHNLQDLGRFDEDAGAQGKTCLDQRRPFRDAVFACPDAGNREVFFRLSGVPFFDPRSGRFLGFRGTATRLEPARETRQETPDARLLEILESTLLRHNDLEWKLSQIQAATGDQGEQLAHLLHELRTPLNAVAGYAELALKRSAKEEAAGPLGNYLENIGEAARHMNALIGDLYKKQVEGVQTPERTGESPPATDLAAVVREACAMAEMAARRRDVCVHRSAAQHSTPVKGGHRDLTQILVNLLANAVKFTPEGGEVGVELRDGASPERPVRLAVWDTGPGIPEAEAEKIFGKGYRLERDRSADRPPGSGLGLAIARQLALQNGAALTCESAPGQGTVFYLDLKAA